MFKNIYILLRNLATLFIVGNMVYWVFPFPAVVWRVALVLLSLFVIFFKEGKRLPCENTVLVFVVFNLIHFFVSYLWKNPSTTQIGNILCALLPLSLFTCLAEKKVMTDRFFMVFGLILIVSSILHFYHAESEALIRMAAADDTDITNNASTSFLMILPMLFLMKNSLQKWASLLVCLFFLVMGAKRGNILAAAIPLGLFVWSVLKGSRRSVIKTILVLALIFGVAFVTYRWVVNDDYLMYRIEQTQEGNSSGRDAIYAGAWHAWHDSDSFVNLLFGMGFDEILQLESTGHKHAHNDWLEVLVNYGLLGVILYLAVFIALFLQVRKIKSYDLRLVLLSGLFIWFSKTLFSMGFTDETLSLAMISMGTVLGRYKTERNQA